MATLVEFLIEQGTENEVFAYFPLEAYSHDGHQKTCYAHVGQHSACHPDYAKECKRANREQSEDLLKELIGLGYEVRPVYSGSGPRFYARRIRGSVYLYERAEAEAPHKVRFDGITGPIPNRRRKSIKINGYTRRLIWL